MMEFILPLLGKLGGTGGLMSALGGGELGTMAGAPMAGGIGATKGSGLMGVLSGGGFKGFKANPLQGDEEDSAENDYFSRMGGNLGITNGMRRL